MKFDINELFSKFKKSNSLMAGNGEESVDCGLIEAEKDWIKSILREYRVSYTRGFIPDEDPMVMVCEYHTQTTNCIDYVM